MLSEVLWKQFVFRIVMGGFAIVDICGNLWNCYSYQDIRLLFICIQFKPLRLAQTCWDLFCIMQAQKGSVENEYAMWSISLVLYRLRNQGYTQ